MNATDHMKALKKRREQLYGSEMVYVDALLYLMRFQQAQEEDIATQLAACAVPSEKGDVE